MKGYTVSRLGQLVGASPDTLRYYERIGLLPEPERSPAGYRLYGDDAVARMRFIKAAQRLGIRLEGISELLAIRERGLCPCGHTRVLLEGKLNQIDAELDALSELRGEIQRMLEERLSSPVEDTACEDDTCGTVNVELTTRDQARPRGGVR